MSRFPRSDESLNAIVECIAPEKYKLTKNSLEYNGVTLYQIKALRDFGNVKKGQLGGYVEHERNIGKSGDCWVHTNCICGGGAHISGDSRLMNASIVWGESVIQGNSMVDSCTIVDSDICDSTTFISTVLNSSLKKTNIIQCIITQGSTIYSGTLYECIIVSGNVKLTSEIEVSFPKVFTKDDQLIIVSNIGRNHRTVIYLPKQDHVIAGCFTGTLSELESNVDKKYKEERTNYRSVIKFFKHLKKNV